MTTVDDQRFLGVPVITWAGTLTATSSIAHGGQTRGITTLLRREMIRQPDGVLAQVPIISGNALRGRLRRIGEELLRGQLGYDGELSPGAAHLLRGGGALVKTGREPLSGSRLARVRSWCRRSPCSAVPGPAPSSAARSMWGR